MITEEVFWGEREVVVSAEMTVPASVVVNQMLTRVYPPCWAMVMDGKGYFTPKSTVAFFTV